MLNVEPKSFHDAVIGAPDVGPDALFELGLRYAAGAGVSVDYVSAHKFFNLAAARGDLRAREERAAIAELMTPAEIATAQRLAREWVQVH